MGKKEDKKPKEDKPSKNNELAVRILAVIGDLRRNGVTEINSTTLRDKVGTKNRAVIRRAM